MPIALQKQYFYEWPSSVKYLGIQIPQKTSCIFGDSYRRWLEVLPRELNVFANYKFTTIGRVAAFKRMVLPKLLSLFRTIPISLPAYY